jgi:hypothetical protein
MAECQFGGGGRGDRWYAACKQTGAARSRPVMVGIAQGRDQCSPTSALGRMMAFVVTRSA